MPCRDKLVVGVQATCGTDGAVLVFDTTTMREHDGSIHSPAIALQIGQEGESVSAIVWLSGTGLLLVGGTVQQLHGLHPYTAC